MKSYTTDNRAKYDKFMRELGKAKRAELVVGILKGETNDEGESIAEYAYYNEYGTAHIPERSFMRTSFDENQSVLLRQLNNVGVGNTYLNFSKLGLMHQTHIKNKINSNIPPPNSPETIARKGSSKTLIDTGAMLNSVNFTIRKVTK